MKLINWKKEYELGIKEIDDEHKVAVETINRLSSIINEDRINEELDSIFISVMEYANEHFATEEKYFDQFNYEDKEAHIEHHRFFTKTISKLHKKHKDKEEAAFELLSFLEDWFLDHLITVDKKYVECFKKHGLK